MCIRAILFFLFLLIAIDLSAQRQAENWYFGEYAGLNFATGNPVTLLDGAMITREGCITVSDTSGRLMFYSDGKSVFNRKHIRMPSGISLFGHASSTQSCIVVPWPGRPNDYFIFTTDALENTYLNGLNYSVVNMLKNNGDGDVVTRNQVLLSGSSEKITAVRHTNGIDVWLISHDIDNNDFLVYIITRNGVNTVPLRQRSGPVVQLGDIGYLKASSLGTRLVMATAMPGLLNLFRFDRASGLISSAVQISNQIAYGAEFSPNGALLYSSSVSDLSIYQYDLSLSDANVAGSRIAIGRTSASSNGALQLAPNGRIYLAHETSANLSEIARPNIRGVGCGYRDRAIDLGGRVSALGLPNMFPAVFSPETDYVVRSRGGCVGDTVSFSLEPRDSVLNLQWNFDDPSSGSLNRGFANDVRHAFRAAGTYAVQVTYQTSSGFDQERIITLIVGTRPQISAGPDLAVCSGQSITLQGSGSAQFVWSPGHLLSDSTSSRPRATISTTTTFILTGKSPEGCASFDTVIVSVSSDSVSVSKDTTICAGSTIKLRASGAQSYQWSPPTGLSDTRLAEPLATPTQTTRYRVIGRSAPCLDTAFVTVTVNQQPAITITKDAMVCANMDVTLEASGGAQYRWEPSIGIADPTLATIVVRPIATTTYTVHVTSAGGCEDSSRVTITVGGTISVDISQDTSICLGTSVDLLCRNGGVVQWTDRSTGATSTGNTLTVRPLTTAWYIVDVWEGGCVGRDSVRVDVGQAPQLVITPDTVICEGDTVTLRVQDAQSATWLPRTDIESPDQSITRVWPLVTTTYTVTANNGGCVSTASVIVRVLPRVAIVLQSEQRAASPGEQLRIPITAIRAIVGLNPLVLSVRAPRSLALINVVPMPGLREVSRADVGADQIVTYEIDSLSAAPALCELNVSVYLSATPDRVITCTASPRGCASEGSMNIVLDLVQCAGMLRAVRFGTQAVMSVAMTPQPFDEVAYIQWSSDAVGLHTIAVYTPEGEMVHSHSWTRTVASSTSGDNVLNATNLSAGVYLVVLRTSSGTRTFMGVSK